jgi:putative ABC transport system permease protein
MNLLATLRIAFRALLRNKLRSFLTALGMIIGVAAVIAMVAIGEGAKSRVEQTFVAMGTNLLIVMSGSSTASGARGGGGSQPTLTWDDLDAIRNGLPGVRYAAPQLRANAQVISEEQNWSTQITGTTPDYLEMRNWSYGIGAPMTESDVDGGTKLAWLGTTVVEKLYGPYANPVGQTVRIRNVPFQVAGVMADKGQSAVGQDFDDVVFVPVTTFRAKIQGGLQKFLNGQIFVSAADGDQMLDLEVAVKNLLRDRHRIAPGAEDDFSIRNLAEAASAMQESTQVLTTLLASIAAVSLLVGGIGIMNIMLVSVTERTREIGLRMAVGARPRDILTQFLVEALVLAAIGGLIGVALGLATASQLAAKFDWPLLVRSDIVGLSVAVSAIVGVVFGAYPARKASLLDPIEALRYE